MLRTNDRKKSKGNGKSFHAEVAKVGAEVEA